MRPCTTAGAALGSQALLWDPNWYSWPLRGPGGGLGRKARGRMWAGGTMGPSQLRQLPGLTQRTAHPILGSCHAFGTWVIKGLALFLSLPCSESFCYPPSESGGRAPGLPPAS